MAPDPGVHGLPFHPITQLGATFTAQCFKAKALNTPADLIPRVAPAGGRSVNRKERREGGEVTADAARAAWGPR